MNRKCPHCGERIPEEAKYCLKCMNYTVELSNPITDQKSKKNNKSKIILICVSILVIIAAAISILISKVSSSSPKDDETVSSNSISTSISNNSQSSSNLNEITSNNTETSEASTTQTTTETKTETTTTTTTSTVPITETTTLATTATKKATSAPKPIINNGILESYPSGIKKSSYKIPYSVKSISPNAFHNKHLKTLYFSNRENLECDWASLFYGLPKLQTIYIYPGTSVDIDGKQYFKGKIVYM